MFSLYFTALKSLAVKETNRYLRIWVQTLVPPVITTSLYFVIFGKMIWGFVIGGVGRSILVGALVTIISLFFVPLHVVSWLMVIMTLLMTAILFSLAGLLNGIFAQSYDDVSIVPTFVLQPLTYLGGVFYAISMLPPFWQAVSKVNPIVYMISGFRYGFLGVQDVSIDISMTILILFIVVLYGICWYLVETGRGLRS